MKNPETARKAASLDLGAALAARVRRERQSREWPLDELANRAGVSRAIISKIERQECSPTAATLGRLSGAFGISMSSLLASAESDSRRLLRSSEQQTWTDPKTRYVRRAVSPMAGAPLQLIEVELPPGAKVPFPASAYRFLHQQIWILSGRLIFREGDAEHDLQKGDCLQLGSPADCVFENRSAAVCRYLVAVITH